MREGKEFSFGELEKLAASEEPFRSLIDPDAPEFAPSGNVPRRIRNSANVPASRYRRQKGPAGRCINESLALKYRMALEEIRSVRERISGNPYGGRRNAERPAVPADGGCLQMRCLRRAH